METRKVKISKVPTKAGIYRITFTTRLHWWENDLVLPNICPIGVYKQAADGWCAIIAKELARHHEFQFQFEGPLPGKNFRCMWCGMEVAVSPEECDPKTKLPIGWEKVRWYGSEKKPKCHVCIEESRMDND